MTDLGTPQERDSTAVGIDENGQVVGNLYVSETESHVVRWADTIVLPLESTTVARSSVRLQRRRARSMPFYGSMGR